MIEQLVLKRWRGFESIELAFEPGTTFVVAPNGVGKTSLLLGMAWALFGSHTNIKAQECIRTGSVDAESQLTLRLSDDQRLVIRRTITVKGKLTSTYELNSSAIDADEAERLMRDAFEVDLSIAAQLSIMVGGGHVATEKALNLQDHLYRALGISGLRQAAAHGDVLARSAVKHRESIRADARSQVVDRSAKQTELQALDVALEEQKGLRLSLSGALDKITLAVEVNAEWQRFEASAMTYRQALATVISNARDLDFMATEATDLLRELGEAAIAVQVELDQLAEQITSARARNLASQTALSLLQGSEPSCPTCLRPFHGSELEQAIRTQSEILQQSKMSEEVLQDAVSNRKSHLASLTHLREAILRLPPETARPDSPPTDGDPKQLADQALVALQAHDKHVGALQHSRDLIMNDLVADEEMERLEQTQQLAYRREAMTRALSQGLSTLADELAQRYVEPLSDQIRWRWKALFGEEGLQLRPDGSIARVVGDRELSWETLSGGERIWARLVTHLLIIGSSTKLPFAWFDEPLEHLDPRARRAVAAALATATRSGGPNQLIVTTYEHAIARQLAADVDEASIKYVRRRPV